MGLTRHCVVLQAWDVFSMTSGRNRPFEHDGRGMEPSKVAWSMWMKSFPQDCLQAWNRRLLEKIQLLIILLVAETCVIETPRQELIVPCHCCQKELPWGEAVKDEQVCVWL